MRITLINSGNDPGIGGNANAQAYPPLGITSLATALRHSLRADLDIRLLDGQVADTEEIIRELESTRPDLVGVSMYNTSIRNTVRIVQAAHGVGATTVLGNDHAAVHHEVLLRKLPEVDYICTSDIGEEFLVLLTASLLTGCDVAWIPGLARRIDGRVVHNPLMRADRVPEDVASVISTALPLTSGPPATVLDGIPIPDRTLLPMSYWEYYRAAFERQTRRTFDTSGVTGVATVNRARGCARSKSPCGYCGIADLSLRASSPDVFWADIRSARDSVGANVIYESFDSATSWLPLLEQWARARPDDLRDTRLFMYAQAAETSKQAVDLFAELGVFCVNTGMDAGDDAALKLLKSRRDSRQRNEAAARRWTDAGIEMHTSLVLLGMGSEDATRRSLDATIEFAQWLARETLTVSLDSAMFYPDKGSPIGNLIWEPGQLAAAVKLRGWDFLDENALRRAHARWHDEVFLDPLELCYDFARVCGVEPELLVEYNRHVEQVSSAAGLNFGHSLAGAEPVD